MLYPMGSARGGGGGALGTGRLSSVVIDAQIFDKHNHVFERAVSPTGMFRPAGFGKCGGDYVWNVFCEAKPGSRGSSGSTGCKIGSDASSMWADDERFLLQGTGLAACKAEPKRIDLVLGIRGEQANSGSGTGRLTPLGPRVWAQQQQKKIAKLKKLRSGLEPPNIVVEGEKIAMESRLWANTESQLEAESVNVSNQASLPGTDVEGNNVVEHTSFPLAGSLIVFVVQGSSSRR